MTPYAKARIPQFFASLAISSLLSVVKLFRFAICFNTMDSTNLNIINMMFFSRYDTYLYNSCLIFS